MRKSDHPVECEASLSARKLRSRGGFTLAEMMAVVLLISLVGVVVISTVDIASKEFRVTTQDSDAQLLCSSLSLFVQNELTYASDYDNSTGTFTERVQGFGSGCSFISVDADGVPIAAPAEPTEGAPAPTTVGGYLALICTGSDGFTQVGSVRAVSNASYVGRKNLTETHNIVYVDGQKRFDVTITIYDGTEVVAQNKFSVKPIIMNAASA
ncbi:MAG: type II secretion system protein [Ruminococcaceae bacterium]|nr:type II secretion system protein [Oscillospiraceae bacterium]